MASTDALRKRLSTWSPTHRSTVIALTVVVLAAGAAAAVGVAVYWPSGPLPGGTTNVGEPPDQVTAEVTEVQPDCGVAAGDSGFDCQVVVAEVSSGTQTGDRAEFQAGGFDGASVDFEPGDRIVLNYVPDGPPEQRYSFADFDRKAPMLLLAVLFAVFIVLIARRQGLFALVGLGASVVVLAFFLLPSLLRGNSPVGVAVVATTLIAVVALYGAHGPNLETTVALLGTLSALALIAILATVFVGTMNLTGLADESATFVQLFGGQIDIRGLLLAGVVVGAVGVLDDITVTQAASVAELRRANPSLDSRELNRRAGRIGRDHIAATVNTLVFAYAGASLPFLLLVVQTQQSFVQAVTSEVVAVEVLRALVGGLGLAAAVPVTTWLASITIGRIPVGDLGEPSHAHTHGAASPAPGTQHRKRRPAPAASTRSTVRKERRPATVEVPPRETKEEEPGPEEPSWEDFGPRSTKF